MSIEEVKERIVAIKEDIKVKLVEATDLLNEGEYDKAETVIESINDLQDELKELNEEVAESSEVSNTEVAEDVVEESNVEDAEERSSESEKTKTETVTETEKEEAEEEEVVEKKEDKKVEEIEKEERSDDGMAVEREVINNVVSNKDAQIRSYLENHVMKRSSIHVEGVKSDSEGVYVPEGLLGNVADLRNDAETLSRFVNVRTVKEPTGTARILNASEPVILPTVAELQKSPEIGVVKFDEVDYKLATRRAYLPVSEETLQDAEGIKEQISEVLKRALVDTENDEILTKVKEDEGIKTVTLEKANDFIGIGLRKKYQKQFIMSTSFYNKVARMEDNEGRSVLHSDLTKPLAQAILGKPVLVLDDEVVGEDFALYGDLGSAVALFHKGRIQSRWVDHLHYGQCFQPVIRLDVKVINPDAVVKLSITDAPVDPEV